MTITIDARSHKTQTTPFPVDPLNFTTDSSWTHHGGTPQGAVVVVIGQQDYTGHTPTHDDEVAGCTYAGVPMTEISGSPFVQTLTGTTPFDANGFVWDSRWWTFHAFYISGCIGDGDQTFAIDLDPTPIRSTLSAEVWTFNTSLGGIACEAAQTQQEKTDHPSFNITSSHTGVVLGALGTDADGRTGFTKTSSHVESLFQDFGVISAAWGEYATVAAGTYNFAYTITTAFSVAPLQPCIEFGFTVYEVVNDPCGGPVEQDYWGILAA